MTIKSAGWETCDHGHSACVCGDCSISPLALCTHHHTGAEFRNQSQHRRTALSLSLSLSLLSVWWRKKGRRSEREHTGRAFGGSKQPFICKV